MQDLEQMADVDRMIDGGEGFPINEDEAAALARLEETDPDEERMFFNRAVETAGRMDFRTPP